ncbi:hypothetical protein GDO81_011934 [Engystomops pustulosus]|uniref:Uncharacterized protein n=1 Tax=Engystomops pustulosus TaxID=76066 RepID=A0AAV7BI99_ENGPU|nr:hypothetical protein GDO81_011934 [Engystomops pustulosus]
MVHGTLYAQPPKPRATSRHVSTWSMKSSIRIYILLSPIGRTILHPRLQFTFLSLYRSLPFSCGSAIRLGTICPVAAGQSHCGIRCGTGHYVGLVLIRDQHDVFCLRPCGHLYSHTYLLSLFR